jgi:hypothetical protein
VRLVRGDLLRDIDPTITGGLGGWRRRGIGETEKRTVRKLLDEELAEQNG